MQHFDTKDMPEPKHLAVVDWIRSLGLAPSDYRSAFAIERGELEWLLHLSKFKRDEDGRPVIDYARNEVVSEPYVAQLGTPTPWLVTRYV